MIVFLGPLFNLRTAKARYLISTQVYRSESYLELKGTGTHRVRTHAVLLYTNPNL